MTITYDVSGSDPGTNSAGATGGQHTLSYAIAQINASDPAGGPYVINLTGDVTLSGPLSPILGSVTIEGNGHTIDAGGATRIFFVGTDNATMTSPQGNPASTTSIISQRQQVTISDVTLANGTAHGGTGRDGGGGGLGAGGALFVNQSADVTLSNVSLSGDSAVGGNGATTRGTTPFTPQGGGGGGGLGGSGGYLGGGGIFGSAGRYGGGGVFGNGGQSAGGGFSGSGGTTYSYGPQGGAVSFGGNGALPVHGLSGSGGGYGPYSGGSVGGAGTSYAAAGSGGGGGFGGGSVTSSNPSAGGFGGGGGASYGKGAAGGFGGGGGGGNNGAGAGGFGGGGSGTRTDTGGAGGFGGGGGGGSYSQYTSNTNVIGGAGGFGGGGGGSDGTLGTFGGASGFGASASTTTQGGGGAGMGGAVFVASGGTLQISGTSREIGSTANGGTGGDGTRASAFGAGIFFQGGAGGTPQTLTFGAGNQSVASQIADLNGAADNTTTGNGLGGTGGILGLSKTGGGTLTLAAANTYTGGTTISGGIVDAAAAGALGSNAVTFAAGAGKTATLALDLAAQPGGRPATLAFRAAAAPGSATFTNTLNDFGADDYLDLKGFTYVPGTTTVTYSASAHTLTVSNGQKSETFNLTDETPDAGQGFFVQSDGAGGTLIDTNGAQVTGISAAPGSGSAVRAGKTVVFTLTVEYPITVTGSPQLTLSNNRVATYSGTDSNGKPQFTYTVAQGDDISDLKVTGFSYNGGTVLTSPSFASQQAFATDSFPNSVATADLNGDGKLDLVVSSAGNDTVSVLLGNGDGTFQAQQSFSVGTGPQSVAITDFNGDHKPDVVVANASSNDVSVLLGNGDGTFQTQQTFDVGQSPFSVTTADVDKDGNPDIVIANNGASSNNVSVLLGKGDGTFDAQTTFAADTNPAAVTTADVDGDGLLDLVVANGGAHDVSVLLGNGNGTFQTQQTFATGSGPNSVTAADVDGDGRLDLVVANSDDSTVSVLLGNGDGTFQTQQTFATGDFPASVTAADVNGDGKPDLLVANFGGGISVLLGNGDGTFQTQQTLAAGSKPTFVAAADINGDGKPDVVTTNFGDGTASVILNMTTPSTFDPSTIASAPGADTGIAIDTVAPPAPYSLVLAPGQDTGASSSDGTTSVNTFNVSGTAQAGLTINLYRDGGVLLDTKVATDGTYSFTTPVLSDGLHSIYTATADAAGNRGGSSNLIKVTVDTAAPGTPPAPTLSPATDTDTQGDGQTSMTQPVMTGTAEAGSTVTLYDTNGTTVLGTAVASSSGKYAITSAGLADGQHQLSVKATDKAGNTSAASQTTSVTIVRPSAPDMVARSDSGISATDDITNVKTPTFTGTADPYATVRLYEGNTLLGTGRTGADGTYLVTSSALGDGTHTLKITATDRSGHTSSLSDGLTIKIDTGKPAAPTSPALTMASDTGASSSDGITSDTTPTVTGTAEAGSTVTLYRDNGVQIGSLTLGATNTAYSFTTPTLSEGLHSLYTTATDTAGNRSAPSVLRKVTIDTHAPNVTIGGGNRTVASANQTISGTGEAGTTVTLSDNGNAIGTAKVASNGSWSKVVSLSQGQNRLVATDTDNAGNVGTSSAVTVTYTPASAMRSLHSMVQAMATMTGQGSSALTPSAATQPNEMHLAAAHG